MLRKAGQLLKASYSETSSDDEIRYCVNILSYLKASDILAPA